MTRSLVRAAGALALAGAVVSCDHEAEVFITPPRDDLFRSYVAIGNSLAAGVQSDGINDSTQRRSYASLLAQSMRTRFAYPALAGRGCLPPINNWQTGTRAGTGSTSTTCDLRLQSSATDILNNVAVPAAGSTEFNSRESPYHNALTTLFLGGKTQIERAIDAQPTFVSIWIGGNDVLQAAATGIVTRTGPSRGITPLAEFTSAYNDAIADLRTGVPGLRGIIVSVPNTANIPLLFPVAAFENPAFLRGFSMAAGAPTGTDIFVHPNCTGSGALVSFAIVPQMRSGAHPRAIVCQKNTAGFPAPVGEIFILDAEDQAALQAAVEGYNNYLEGKAGELDFAYYDVNPFLASLKSSGCATTVPNLAASGATSPFGACFSFDGIHPSNTGYARVANELINRINEKYRTSLGTVPVP